MQNFAVIKLSEIMSNLDANVIGNSHQHCNDNWAITHVNSSTHSYKLTNNTTDFHLQLPYQNIRHNTSCKIHHNTFAATEFNAHCNRKDLLWILWHWQLGIHLVRDRVCKLKHYCICTGSRQLLEHVQQMANLRCLQMFRALTTLKILLYHSPLAYVSWLPDV